MLQTVVPELGVETRRAPEVLQTTVKLRVPAEAVPRFEALVALPFRAIMLKNVLPAVLLKKPRILELFGAKASIQTSPRWLFPLENVYIV